MNIDVNKSEGGHSPLFGSLESLLNTKDTKCLEIIKELIKRTDLIVDRKVFLTAMRKKNNTKIPNLLKVILSVKNIDPELLKEGFHHCCKENFLDGVILILQRNVKFDYDKTIEYLKDNNEMKVVIEEFMKNKSLFRHKYGSLEKYNIGIKVREFIKVAFVLGNNDYDHFQKLKSCVNDSIQIKNVLKKSGFLVHQFENLDADDTFEEFDNFVFDVNDLLIDPNNEHLKHRSLLVFFFFAGHGVTFENESFMLPIDFKNEYFAKKSNLYSKALTVSHLNNIFSLFERESVNIIVLDACRSVVDKKKIEKLVEAKEAEERKKKKEIEESKKKSEKKKTLINAETRDVSGNVIIEEKTRENFVYCYATDPNAAALDTSLIEDGNKDNSPFTIALIDNLSQKGNFEDILKSVRNKVLELTLNNQKPWTNASLSFPIMWNEEEENFSVNLRTKSSTKTKLGKKSLFDDDKIICE